MSPDTDAPFLPDSEFDLRARAELAIAFEPATHRHTCTESRSRCWRISCASSRA